MNSYSNAMKGHDIIRDAIGLSSRGRLPSSVGAHRAVPRKDRRAVTMLTLTCRKVASLHVSELRVSCTVVSSNVAAAKLEQTVADTPDISALSARSRDVCRGRQRERLSRRAALAAAAARAHTKRRHGSA